MKQVLKKGICYIGLLAVLISIVPMGHGNEALAGQSYQSAIDKAKKEKEELEKKRKEAADRIAALEADKKSTEEYIQKVDEELSAAYAQMEDLEERIALCADALDAAELELDEAKATKENQYATMKARIKYMYEIGETSFWELLTGSDSLEDLLNQVEYRSQIAEYDDNLLKRYEATCEEVKAKEESYALAWVELTAEKEEQQLLIDNLAVLVANKAAYMDELTATLGITEEQYFEFYEEIESKELQIADLEEKEKKRIEEEERKRREEEERLKREAEERRKREEALKKLGLTDETSIDNMIWPFPGDPNIYSYFGYRTSPITGKREYHSGIDIGGAYGADIVASLAGQVTKATWSSMNGNHVVIDHGNGVTTHYLHASKLLVKAGDYVKQGQVIMKCGSTGWSTAPHLHFTIRVNGALVDPCDYVSP
ncbi:MAG: peptidoglycan DD-metalloendopeptidase family protein [Lachnospiraceae bacterium]|nr:peptidoglycan DD-metalloendopeptidase family protein [Lachnospiraceae bacterium]